MMTIIIVKNEKKLNKISSTFFCFNISTILVISGFDIVFSLIYYI